MLAELLFERGQLLLQAGQYDGARVVFGETARSEKLRGPALGLKGYCLSKWGCGERRCV